MVSSARFMPRRALLLGANVTNVVEQASSHFGVEAPLQLAQC